MRIRKLYLKDIGPFNEVEFEFKPQEKGKAEIHILTGPNGSGKTTVLHALVNIFDFVDIDEDTVIRDYVNDINNFSKRMRSEQKSSIIIEYKKHEGTAQEETATFRFPSLNTIDEDQCIKGEYVALAYSGYRTVGSSNIDAIQEIGVHPLKDALTFDKDSSANFAINQWIANNISKRAIEREKHNTSQANKYASAIVILEKVITELVGYEIKFSLRTSPLSLIIITSNTELEFDVLPDGLRAAISWIGDVLMRLDRIYWEEIRPINEQSIILFLDEIEVHLHPAWQRKVLPAVQKLFPNAQIFLTTHSPFVVNSIDGAWVYKLEIENGKARLDSVTQSKSGRSYENVLREIFEIDESFGGETQTDLDLFYQYRNEILAGDESNESKFVKLAKKLAKESIEQQSVELQSIIGFELRQVNKIKRKNYSV